MFPYRDENETIRTPIVTIGIVAINVIIWLLIQGAGSEPALQSSVLGLGLIPAELSDAPQDVLTSMFLHGSWMHLLGNMWFLWLFGNNVEDAMGRGRFTAFYLLCGIAAALAQVATKPGSVIPMVGASGAISGVMGAYVILYPKVRVFTLVPLGFFMTTIALPAWVMLGYWMLLQVVSTLPALAGAQEGGVAFWAHIGGFIAGAALIKLFVRKDYLAEHAARHWQPKHLGFKQGKWM